MHGTCFFRKPHARACHFISSRHGALIHTPFRHLPSPAYLLSLQESAQVPSPPRDGECGGWSRGSIFAAWPLEIASELATLVWPIREKSGLTRLSACVHATRLFVASGPTANEPPAKRARAGQSRLRRSCCGTNLPRELFGLGRCPSCTDYDGPPSDLWPPDDSTPLRTEMRLEDFIALEHVTARQWGPFSPFSDTDIEIAQAEIMRSRQLLRQVSVMEQLTEMES